MQPVVLLFSPFVILLPGLLAQGNQISGRVSLETGGAVQNGRVIIGHKLAVPAGQTPGVAQVSGAPVANVALDKQGQFTVPPLPDGDYAACVATRLGTVLSSCEWVGAGAHEFTVKNGNAPAINIKLAKGSPLRVHVSDAGGALVSQKNGKNTDLTLHVTGPAGNPIPLLPVVVTATGRDYQITVPFDTDVNLHASSAALNLTDDKGVQTASPKIPVKHSSADPATRTPVTITVLGAHD